MNGPYGPYTVKCPLCNKETWYINVFGSDVDITGKCCVYFERKNLKLFGCHHSCCCEDCFINMTNTPPYREEFDPLIDAIDLQHEEHDTYVDPDQHDVSFNLTLPFEVQLYARNLRLDRVRRVQFQRSDAILLALNDRFYNNVAIGAIAHYCRLTENSIEIIFRMCEDMNITTDAQLLEMMEHVFTHLEMTKKCWTCSALK